MHTKSSNPTAGLNPAAFAVDAVSVIALRVSRIAAGGRAGRKEAKLMVTEKIAALAQVQWNLMSGAYGFTPKSMTHGVGNHYARAVRANRERLSGSGKR